MTSEEHVEFAKRCHPGWSKLIDETHRKMLYLDPDYRVAQIKEKYGTLRYYFFASEEVDGLVVSIMCDVEYEAEQRSTSICEQCGKFGRLRGTGWFYTACDECADEREKPFDLAPEEGGLHGGIPDTTENQIFFRRLSDKIKDIEDDKQ